MVTAITSSVDPDIVGVCPNCRQWQRTSNGGDCTHRCIARGFARRRHETYDIVRTITTGALYVRRTIEEGDDIDVSYVATDARTARAQIRALRTASENPLTCRWERFPRAPAGYFERV